LLTPSMRITGRVFSELATGGVYAAEWREPSAGA
jgi:hypothetical protein